jgi:hypothetical protein
MPKHREFTLARGTAKGPTSSFVPSSDSPVRLAPLSTGKEGTLPQSGAGLVLDDLLHAFASVRQQFELSEPNFGLKEIETYVGARKAIERIIKDTDERHGSEIYSKVHSLLAGQSMQIYSEWTNTPAYSGHKIHPDRVTQALRRMVEVGLQTLAQLPSRQPKSVAWPKRLKSVAAALSRLAQRAKVTVIEQEVLQRVNAYFAENPSDRARLTRIPDEIQWAAEVLDGMARLKAVKIRIDSSNPQVNLALYVVGWFEACTGRRQYENFKTIIAAAFHAAGKSTPRWVDRLEIEMHMKKKRRRGWIKTISS